MEVVEVSCPYCGERADVIIDAGGGERQDYVEDCPVCCQPWAMTVERTPQGGWNVVLLTTDE